MCKILAEKMNCPVIILSQLSRAVTSRSSNVPQLSDLRESGEIEQDADVVMLLHREGYYDSKANQTEAQLYIAKNRDGQTGVIKYEWIPNITNFEEFKKR